MDWLVFVLCTQWCCVTKPCYSESGETNKCVAFIEQAFFVGVLRVTLEAALISHWQHVKFQTGAHHLWLCILCCHWNFSNRSGDAVTILQYCINITKWTNGIRITLCITVTYIGIYLLLVGKHYSRQQLNSWYWSNRIWLQHQYAWLNFIKDKIT